MAEARQPFALKESDKQSETWGRLKKHLLARREQLRIELENTEEGQPAMKVRGQLKEVALLLALDKDSPPGS